MSITFQQIRTGRLMARLAIDELAELTGIRAARLQAIENGHIKNPTPRTLESIRAALERHGVQFAVHGWLRHVHDRATSTIDMEAEDMPWSFDVPSVLPALAERMASAPFANEHRSARLLQVLGDEELSMHNDLIMDALRIGLLALGPGAVHGHGDDGTRVRDDREYGVRIRACRRSAHPARAGHAGW